MGTRCACRAWKRGAPRTGWAFALAALVCLATGSASWADDSNTGVPNSSVSTNAVSAAPLQASGNSWSVIEGAVVGSGNQTLSVFGNANTGSGDQNNSEAAATNWRNITNANAGSGAQVVDSVNSNGRDRKSGRLRSQRGDPELPHTPDEASQSTANNWTDIGSALVGTANQTRLVGGSGNTGSGAQSNSLVEADNWSEITNANAGSGGQVTKSSGSSGRDRESDSLELGTSDGSSMLVSQSVLESSVSKNAVIIAESGSSSDSSFAMRDNSQVSGLLGMNAIAIAAGANMSQNVSVSMLGILSTEPASQNAGVAPAPAIPVAAPPVGP